MSLAKDFIMAQVQGKPVTDVLSFEYDYKKYMDEEKKIILRQHHKFDGYLMATSMFDCGDGELLYGSRVAVLYDRIGEKAIIFILQSKSITSWCNDLLIRSIIFSCDNFQHEIDELYSTDENTEYIPKILVKCEGFDPITSLQSDFVFSLPPLKSFNVTNFKNIQLNVNHDDIDVEDYGGNYDVALNRVKSDLNVEDYTLVRNPSGKSLFIHFM